MASRPIVVTLVFFVGHRREGVSRLVGDRGLEIRRFERRCVGRRPCGGDGRRPCGVGGLRVRGRRCWGAYRCADPMLPSTSGTIDPFRRRPSAEIVIILTEFIRRPRESCFG